MALAIRIQVTGAKDGARHVVAVCTVGGAGFICEYAALEVNVYFNVAVVSVSHDHTGAIVGTTACVGYAQGVGAVVLRTNAVFRLCRCFFLLHQRDVWVAGKCTDLVGCDLHAESSGAGFQDLTHKGQMALHRCSAASRVAFHIHFPLAADPHIVGHVAGVKLGRELHLRQQGRNEGQAIGF